MSTLNFNFPSVESIKSLIEGIMDDSEATLIQSYFSGVSIDSDKNFKVRGYTLYGYNDDNIDEYTYMIIGWTYHTDGCFYTDDLLHCKGFDTIDEADEFLNNQVNN